MNTWHLSKEFKFEASHQLQGHDGKCRRLHGHSWVGVLTVRGHELIPEGAKKNMLWDYGDMKRVLDPYIEGFLDHWHLNETLAEENPTSEFVARWLYEKLAGSIPFPFSIEIRETCTSACRYEKIQS